MKKWLVLALSLLAAPAMAAGGKPNFVVILADDLGAGAAPGVPTPGIDSIARAGVTFTNGYASAAMCTPTRAGLLTGQYQQQFGVVNNIGEADKRKGLPLNLPMLPKSLKTAGYHTGMVGKWHLGNTAKNHPLKYGFDEFYGFQRGKHTYFGTQVNNPIVDGTKPVPATGYLTDTFTREAVNFIDRNKDRPFFLYLAYNAPHDPLQAKPEKLAEFGNLFNAVYSSMDDGIQTVVNKLKAEGLFDNTMVIYLGDNGCAFCTSPFRGKKNTWYEGGLRVPFVVSWPGHTAADAVAVRPVMSIDIMPTILQAAGVAVPAPVDGKNLLQLYPDRYLFWGKGSPISVRQGEWKLLNNELYNLDKDPRETHNVAGANPAVVARLKAARSAWGKTLARPLW